MLTTLFPFCLAVLIGFVILIWGAERFVIGAASTAFNLGVTPLVIGLTIVSLGTSTPEFIVATMSSLEGQAGLAIGNAIGSNIANISLILAFTVIILPISVRSGIVSRELPLLMLVTFIGLLLLWDQELSRFDGILLITGMVMVLIWIVHHAKQQPEEEVKKEFDIEIKHRMSTRKAILLLLFSIALLLIGSRVLVWGAIGFAKLFGVSDLVIGLTIIAIGTSLPELAASIAAAWKNHHELVLGNLIGSNIFNIFGVLAIPGLLAPGKVAAEVVTRDLPIMTILTVALFATAYSFGGRRGRITRYEGFALLAGFFAYLVYLYYTTV
ncbi:MAG: calcium/sodium antiporter [Gammaproteobacteria bacterium]|nr:calcium/sodium antiporter [Gammaproteobacteria bacterium]